MGRSNEQYELFCETHPDDDHEAEIAAMQDALWQAAVQMGRCEMLLERYEREDLKLGLAVDTKVDRRIKVPF